MLSHLLLAAYKLIIQNLLPFLCFICCRRGKYLYI